jgi:RNA 2',3'-cyclic 3'-phosphodiesterase
VDGSERLRLFCGLSLPDDVVERIVPWQLRELPAGRVVPPENLHVTLAFLGSQAAGNVGAISAALRDAAGSTDAAGSAEPPCLRVRGYRETRSVGMLTFDDEGGRATALAERLHGALEELGLYHREDRPWLAHLTVLRFRERPRQGRSGRGPALPELGPVVPSDAAVFISRLRPSGAVYEAVEVVSLGG